MDEELKKERFEKLGIKTSVAIRFRKFCKKMSRSQSMTLMLMLDFFEENGISPAESMGPRMETLEMKMSLLIKKRMNGMIAILKDIEKSQTKPTAAMLYSLFEQSVAEKKPLLVEKKYSTEKKQVQYREKNSDNETLKNRWKK
tara:strand:- start:7133 stop:7561 length:429 start_codon:yes stop_codon:yes gene_type:complete